MSLVPLAGIIVAVIAMWDYPSDAAQHDRLQLQIVTHKAKANKHPVTG